MTRLAVQTSVPNSSPDTLLATSPPGTALLVASRSVRLRATSTGDATVRPYYYTGDHVSTHTWAPVGRDAASSGALSVSATGSFERAFPGRGESRYWIVVRESGAGTVTADLDASSSDLADFPPDGGSATLPTGAATAVKQDTGNVSAAATAAALGTTADAATLSTVVGLLKALKADIAPATWTPTPIASSASAVELAAANAARRGLAIFNNSTAKLAISVGGTADLTTGCDYILPAGGYWEMPKPISTAAVSGIWEAVDGSANVREAT